MQRQGISHLTQDLKRLDIPPVLVFQRVCDLVHRVRPKLTESFRQFNQAVLRQMVLASKHDDFAIEPKTSQESYNARFLQVLV